MTKTFYKKGFSMLEFLIAVAIALIVIFLITVFAKDIINLNASAQSSMTAVLEGRKIVNVIVTELRSAIPSALGSYTIEAAATSSITFFADVNSDDVADHIRYFYDSPSRSLQRGVILATGSPPGYTTAENLSTLINDVYNDASTPIFDYYDGSFDGSGQALVMPVNILDIRLVKVTVQVEKDPNRGPGIIDLTSNAALRNLKDNT